MIHALEEKKSRLPLRAVRILGREEHPHARWESRHRTHLPRASVGGRRFGCSAQKSLGESGPPDLAFGRGQLLTHNPGWMGGRRDGVFVRTLFASGGASA